MLDFAYTAKNNATGQNIKSNIQADTEKDAIEALKAQGLIILDLKQKSGIIGQSKGSRTRIRAKDKVLFARQLSTLMNAGLPLTQSLRNVASQTGNKHFKSVINNIVISVEGGKSLSSAMSKYPTVFNQLTISLIAAGESSGTLDKSLDRIAVQLEKDADIVSKIRGAMIYPIIVLLVMIGVVVFMLVKVLPQVNVLYQAFPGSSLPIETKILLAVSHFITSFWWLLLIIIVVGGFFLFRWLKTDGGKSFF